MTHPAERFGEFQHGRAETNGVELHYRRSGSGPPLVLLHGWPQHSLMWHAIVPPLSERFDVIAPDQRGAGASSITASGYDKTNMAKNLAGLLDALEVETVDIAAYDLGAGVGAAFARDYPERVRRLAVIEFGLAGFGYEEAMQPQPDWSLSSNWHLALFTVPEAAVWLCTGRERELLTWFFYHLAYSGNASISQEHFELYLREISKPGALRAGIGYYAAVWQDARDNAVLKERPLAMPVLALGGESSSGPALEQIWGSVASDLRTEIIPRAGHWISDENPQAVATALLRFFFADELRLSEGTGQ